GLVVTPLTFRVRISSARLPVVIRPRERSSSQMLTPAAVSCSVGVLIVLLGCSVPGCSAVRSADRRDRGARRVHDGVGGDAELLEQGLVVGGGAEVLDGDRTATVSDDAAPGEGYTCFDGDPGGDGCRQHMLPVRLVLLGEPLQRRRGHDA